MDEVKTMLVSDLPAEAYAKKKSIKKDLLKAIAYDKYLYILLLPILIYFIIFKYAPMVGLSIAFKDFKLSDSIFSAEWVGLKHFIRLFTSEDFYQVFRNTFLLSIYGIVFSFPVPIVLSIFLNEVRFTVFKRTIQSILYIPHFISWVVLGGIVISILSPSTGVINALMTRLGIEPIFFMSSKFWWPVVYIVSGIWQTAGWGTIIYLAAISSIDAEQYEAAIIDGAKKRHQIFYITIPGITGTIAIMLILRMGSMLNIGFEHIYMLQNPAVRTVSEVFSTYEYKIGLESAQYSYTTALGLFKGVVGLVLITITNRIVKLLGHDGLW